jgi:hypothetical protein
MTAGWLAASRMRQDHNRFGQVKMKMINPGRGERMGQEEDLDGGGSKLMALTGAAGARLGVGG